MLYSFNFSVRRLRKSTKNIVKVVFKGSSNKWHSQDFIVGSTRRYKNFMKDCILVRLTHTILYTFVILPVRVHVFEMHKRLLKIHKAMVIWSSTICYVLQNLKVASLLPYNYTIFDSRNTDTGNLQFNELTHNALFIHTIVTCTIMILEQKWEYFL